MKIIIPGEGVFALGRGHISHIVKMHYFFQNCIMTPRTGVPSLGRGYISDIVNMHYFFKIFSTPRHRSHN